MKKPSIALAAVVFLVTAPLLALGIKSSLHNPGASFSAKDPSELVKQIFTFQGDIIEAEIGQRVSAATSLGEARARWIELEKTMVALDATPTEAKVVLAKAKNFLPTRSFGVPRNHLPLLVKRGFVENKKVWVTICVAAGDDPKLANKPEGWNYWITVIDPQKPSKVLSANSRPRY